MRILRFVDERHHRDDEGRLLREGRTPAELIQPGDIEYKQCHYAGSRHLKNPMNVSALRQSSERWDELVDALAFVRTAYAEVRGSYAPDVMDVWRVSQLGCALPWFFILRGEVAPAYAAALSKITLGTALLSHRLLHDQLVLRQLPPPLTATTLRDLSESTGTLLGDTEVCAAPDRMLVELLEVLVAGEPAHVGGVARLAAEREDVLRFGAFYANFKLLLWVHCLARRFLYADLAASPGLGAVPELGALLAAECEPPDCFLVEPPAVATIPPAIRALWFTALAGLVVPIAPDGSDRRLGELARELATVMGAGLAPRPAYEALDAGFGEVMRVAELGLGGTVGEIDAATRDRLLGISPRAMFARLEGLEMVP